MKSTLWRDSRRRQEYRDLSRKLDAGLYALAQLSVRDDNNLEIDVDAENIRRDLQRCISLLKHLRIVADDPAYGDIEEVHLVDATDLTDETLGMLISELTFASITLFPPESDTVRETLKDLEQYTKRKAEQHNRR